MVRVTDGPEPAAEVLSRHKLPNPGGHDLLRYDQRHLSVTVGRGAYLFDCDSQTFSPLPGLADQSDLKSVNRHPVTGQVMFTQATKGKVHANKLQWTDGTELPLPYEMLYKARWNVAER